MISKGKKLVSLLVVAIAGMSTGCSADTSQLAAGEVTTWKCDKEKNTKEAYVYKPYDYIIQAPADTVGVSGSDDLKTSVILNSADSSQKLPAGWTLGKSYSYEKNSDGGFTIAGNANSGRGEAVKQTMLLNAANGKLRVQNGGNTANLQCTRIGNWKNILGSVKYGPGVAYLEKRLSVAPFLRKQIGDIAFTSEVAKESSLNDDYRSVYGLLSPFPSSALTTQDADLVETAKKKLIDNDASSYDVWEWNNSWQGGMIYSDEEKSSRCGNLSGSTYVEGYKIASSTSQDRIAGTNLTCHGTLHLLKKEGALQADQPADLFPSY